MVIEILNLFGISRFGFRMCSDTIVVILIAYLVAADACQAEAPPVTAIAVSPDGQTVVWGSCSGVRQRSWKNDLDEEGLPSQLDHVHVVRFSPNTQWLAVAGGSPAQEGTLELLAWPTTERRNVWTPHEDVIFDVDWHPTSSRIATASLDRRALEFDLMTRRVIHEFSGHSRGLTAVCYIEKGRQLVTASLDHSLRLWDTQTGALLRTLNNHTAPVLTLAVRPEVEPSPLPLVASAGKDKTVRFWQPTIGRLVRFARLEAVPLHVEWTPDSRRLVAACDDGSIRVVDPETVTVIHKTRLFKGQAYSLAIHPRLFTEAIAGGPHDLLKRFPLVSIERPSP